jgi:CelD/BcsL family acetyltransferase involved in cellulose biosynthesis
MPRDRFGGWRFEWKRSWPDVWAPDFVDRWNRLRRASPTAHVYQNPAVVRAWAETCGASVRAEPLVGMAVGPGGVEVLVPWTVHRVRGRVAARRQLAYAGDDLFGYHDPLAAGDAVDATDWSDFWQSARAAVSDLHDQAIFRAVGARLAPAGAEPSGDKSSVLHFSGAAGFDRLFESCSASHRGDVRRCRRRLAERGEVSLWVAGRDEGEQALADWKTGGAPAYRDLWTRRNRRNTTWRPGLDDLLARLLTQGLAEGWGHYTVLRVDGESIAWHVGLADSGRLYWWIPAHRYECQSFSPGKLLLAAVIEHLMKQGWRELHFLAGEHAYKLAWHPDGCDLRALRWHAPGLRGAIFSWYDALRSA